MRWVWLTACLGIAGCEYITREEFEAHLDADQDGWPKGDDCDDANPSIFPYAPDVRGDGCNADCGATGDQDGDDWPDSVDCDPEDNAVFPCAPDVEGDSVDADCDGEDGERTDICPVSDPDFEASEQVPFGELCSCPAGDAACNTVAAE